MTINHQFTNSHHPDVNIKPAIYTSDTFMVMHRTGDTLNIPGRDGNIQCISGSLLPWRPERDLTSQTVCPEMKHTD